MAVDSALLDWAERDGVAVLRLYRWDPFCLSFGRHEPATRRYDRARIKALGLDTVRRPTGGRAVWHAQELTYSITAKLGSDSYFQSLPSAYCTIHRMLADALIALGIPAVLAAPGKVPGPDAGPCFAAPVGGEVLVNGHKVIGSSQVRQGDAFLQHGSLLLENHQALLGEIGTSPASPTHSAPSAPSAPLGHPVSYEEAARAIASAAATRFGAMSQGPVPPALAPDIARHAERFRSDEWTWAR
jgi:lipoate-protein ligase A